MTRRAATIVPLLAAALLAGCGADTGGIELSSSDELAQPGQTIEVRTTIARTGVSRLLPPSNPGKLRVYRDNELLAEHQPGSAWSFVTPVTLDAIGEHVIDAVYQRRPEAKPDQAACYAYCWDASRVGIVVDIDEVLNVTTPQDRFFGDRPLGDLRAGSAEALADLGQRFFVCYVTSLPASLKDKVHRWLRDNKLPGGPVFNWNRGMGNIRYGGNQAAVLAGLRQRVPTLLIGIGAGAGDLDAFRRNGMLAVMIQTSSAPPGVPRFSNWDEAYQLFSEPANQAIFADPARMLELHLQGGKYMQD